MANIGDIYQYSIATNSSLTIQLDSSLSAKIGLSSREKKIMFHDDLSCEETHYNYDTNEHIILDNLVPVIMTINYADGTSNNIQLGQTFMYESQVAMKISNITFNGKIPIGTYLEVVYE